MKKDDYELIFDFKNPNQIINMGGPWIGDLFLKKHIICKGVLIDSQNFYPKEEKLFFVKYHEVSKWRVHNFFTINYWNKKTINYLNRTLNTMCYLFKKEIMKMK